MTKQTRRRLITTLVLIAATSVLLVAILSPKKTKQEKENIETTTAVVKTEEVSNQIPISSDPPAPVVDKPPPPTNPIAPFDVLSVQQQKEESTPIVLGALDDIEKWQMEVHLTRTGAGISSIRFSNIFETVDGKLAWNQYRKGGGTVPPIDDLYLLTTERTVQQQLKPVLGAFQVSINDQGLPLSSAQHWNVAEITENSVLFVATIIDTKKNTIATIHRKWTLNAQFGLQLEQSIQNLTAQEMDVRWLQYGPSTLTVDRSRYMDRRRFRFGWELSDEFDPNHSAPIQSNDFYLEFTDVTKERETTVWPTEETLEEGFKLSWFGFNK